MFFDEADLDAGDQLPAGIVDGLFGAGVVVCFCDEAYFSRWYCLREFHVALGAFNALVRDGGSERDKDEALLPVVIALPEAGPARRSWSGWPPGSGRPCGRARARARTWPGWWWTGWARSR